MNVAYNMDCIEAMKGMKDNQFDLAIVDPPYRDVNEPTRRMRKSGSMKTLEGRPNKNYYNELKRVSKNQIIWGANNFNFEPFKGFIVWKKITISENFTLSMAEIASISEDLGTTSKVFECLPQSNNNDPRIHPTQKPIALYKWVLTNYAKQGDKILDTHLGSGSSRIACYDLGFDFVGYELEKEYFDLQEKRFGRHINQTSIFEVIE